MTDGELQADHIDTTPQAAAPRPVVGDADFDALYRDRWSHMVRLAALLLADTGEAEQVAQDAFIRTYRRWGRMRDVDGAAAYVRVSVINGARSVLRHRRVTRVLAPFGTRYTAPADDGLMADEQHRAIVRAVAKLPPRQREVVVLRYWANRSEAEIATDLHIARGTVKSTAARGLSALHRILEVDDER